MRRIRNYLLRGYLARLDKEIAELSKIQGQPPNQMAYIKGKINGLRKAKEMI